MVQYLMQLAVITPYARLSLRFVSALVGAAAPTEDDDDIAVAGSRNRRDFCVQYERRSEQMPPVPTEVLLGILAHVPALC